MKDDDIDWIKNVKEIFPLEWKEFKRISGRNPTVKFNVTIEEDVRRRDFTINALFFDIDKGEIIDLVGGMDDIDKGVIRCVGDPVERFNEDRLRVLRAARFAARFSFDIDKDTLGAIKSYNKLEGPDKSGKIVPIVRERINEELGKAMEQSIHHEAYFDFLNDTGLLQQVLPGSIYPEKFLSGTHYRIPTEAIFASLYYKSSKAFHNVHLWVEDFKFPVKLAEAVDFLLDVAKAVHTTDNSLATLAYTIAKRRGRVDLTDEDLSIFLHWVMEREQEKYTAVALSLCVYRLSVSGEELIKEGMKQGEELGREIRSREYVKFESLLEETSSKLRNIK